MSQFRLNAHEWGLATHIGGVEYAANSLNEAATQAITCGDPRQAIAILAERQRAWMDCGAQFADTSAMVAEIIAQTYGEEWRRAAWFGDPWHPEAPRPVRKLVSPHLYA